MDNKIRETSSKMSDFGITYFFPWVVCVLFVLAFLDVVKCYAIVLSTLCLLLCYWNLEGLFQGSYLSIKLVQFFQNDFLKLKQAKPRKDIHTYS